MLPFLLIFPWSLLLLALWKEYKSNEAGGGAHAGYDAHRPSSRGGRARGIYEGRGRRGWFTTADYLQHLNEAIGAARVLDAIKPYALQGDVTSLMNSSGEVLQAIQILGAPIEIAFVQKDLNVLGADPPLRENGVMDRPTVEAIAALQQRFNQPSTGDVSWETAIAIRYSVGCIHSQDRIAATGG